MSPALIQTSLGDLPLTARGKVRDIYDLGNDQLLFVATDRISAFDHVLATGITGKGRILTQLSLFWFDLLKDTVKHHLSNIFDKLGVSTRLELALFAVNQALPLKSIA